MAPHSSTLAWEVPWVEEPDRLQSMGLLRLDTTERLHFHSSLSCIGEGHGNPLQCSCLENPRDGGAWWAAIYGVAAVHGVAQRQKLTSLLPLVFLGVTPVPASLLTWSLLAVHRLSQSTSSSPPT